MNLTRANRVSKKHMERFSRRQSQLIALIGVMNTFPSFCSGVRSYFSFCELNGAKPFPVNDRTILLWGSLFGPCRHFPNYVNYLKKACFFLDEPIARHTPAVIDNAKSLKLSGRSDIRFPNFLDSEKLLMMMTREGWAGDFPLLAYAAYLFALRVPSEDIPIRGAFRNDSME